MLANFHGERHLVYPALRSITLAVQEAARKGVFCRILVVIDRGDPVTREQVHRFAGPVDIEEIECGNLGDARNYGMARIDTKYTATLDGDDLFDRDWLWKGVRFLEELKDDRAVGHTQVRLSFGNELCGRLHLPSASSLFHPLYLISSWQYAADLILPTPLYQHYPLTPNDHENGLAAEDWFWTCESIVNGIRHVIIPETVYFYRRQASHLSLGMVPGVTYHPTRLLDKVTLEAYTRDARSPSALLLAGSLDSVTGPIERWTKAPRWLKQSVIRACELDFEIYDLHQRLPSLPLETPPSYPAVGYLYLKLMGMIDNGRRVMMVFTDHLASDTLGILDAFLAAHREKDPSPPDILIVSLSPDGAGERSDPCASHRASATILPEDGVRPRLSHIHLGNDPAFARLSERLRYDLIVRFLMQTRPDLTVNMDSGFFDRLIGAFGRSLAASPTRTLRICFDDMDETLAGWQALSLANGHYAMALCRNSATARRLTRYFNGTEMTLYSCTEPPESGRFRAFGEGLCDLFDGSPGGSRVRTSTGLPPFRRPRKASSAGDRPDVSCILSVHLEGHHLNQTLRALAGICADARRNHLNTELIVVADHVGPRTQSVLASLSQLWPEARILETELDNEGAVRNAGIAAAAGRWVAIMDGTDMGSPEWLTRAVRLANTQGPNVILHPHAVIEHGDDLLITYQPDMNEFNNCIENLVSQEVWTTNAFASRDLFIRHPYHSLPPPSGYGQVTWHWNCETVMAGCRHRIVEDTFVYRRPSGFAGEYRVRLGQRPETALPQSRFFSDHVWLSRKAKTRNPWLRKAGMTLSKVWAFMNRIPNRRPGLSPPAGWDDEAYLKASEDVRLAVAAGLFPSGYAHYCRHGHAEARGSGWKTDRLLETLRSFSSAHPALRLAPSSKATVRAAQSSVPANVYRACRQKVAASQPTHLFLAAALRPGGSELIMLHAIEAVLSVPSNRALVLTTETHNHRWRHRLPSRCAWLSFADLASGLAPEEQARILTLLLINSNARCLHLFFSALGWQILRRHAPALANRMKLFISLFAIPPAETGMGVGYSRFVGALNPYLTGIFTDNHRMAGQLSLVSGMPSDKIRVVRHPVIARPRFSGPTRANLPVLWANRLDRDKRVDLLIEIARKRPGISFHVYGEPVLNGNEYLEAIRKIPNIDYRGTFVGFDSIPAVPYRCFLHTSSWEGLPNTILEAMRSGLLVVAPDVGGIAEVVEKDSGILIRNPNDAQEYAEALTRIVNDPDSYRVLAETGSRRITAGYTHAHFLHQLSTVPGYL